jgi:putative hydrolase of the HAD superfamily
MSDGYRAVLFDFFGTLTRAVTRGPAHLRVAEILGCDPDRFTDVLNRSYGARLRGEYGEPDVALRRIAAELGQRPSAAVVAEATRVRRQAIGDDVTLRAGAVWTLWTVRARGLRTGLVSDCTDELPALVATLPIATHLDATVYSVELGVSKPDPAMFLTASRRLNVPPEQCLYIGDGGGRELSGARRTGMTAVRLAAPDLVDHLSFDREPEWHGPTVVDLREVLHLAVPGWRRHTERYWSDERAYQELAHREADRRRGQGRPGRAFRGGAEFVDAGRG